MNNFNNKDLSAQEEIKQIKKNTLKILFYIFLASFIYLIYWVYFDEHTLVESQSPFENKEVIITELGHGLLNDSGRIKIYFKEDGRTRKSKKIHVDNFLESNSKGRYHIIWSSDQDRVSISIAFEQSIQGVNYKFSSNTIEIH